VKIYAVVTVYVLASLPILAWNHNAPAVPLDRAARLIVSGPAAVFPCLLCHKPGARGSDQPRSGDLDVYLRAA